MSRSIRFVAAGCLSLALAACLPGPETLLERATAEVIVTGAAPGDRLRLEVAEAVRVTVVEESQPIYLYLELPAGQHPARLELSRGEPAERLCARFLLEVEDGERRSTSIDLLGAARCPEPDAGPEDGGADAGDRDAGVDGGDPDDGGFDDGGPDDGGFVDGGFDDGGFVDGGFVDGGFVDGGLDDGGLDGGGLDDGGFDDGGPPNRPFIYLREDTYELQGDCDGESCRVLRITAEDDGDLKVSVGDDGPQQGSISEDDLALLVGAALSPEADLLFAGADPGCAEPRPAAPERHFLERRRQTTMQGVGTITERVDVTGCEGTALELRLRLRFLKDLVLGGS